MPKTPTTTTMVLYVILRRFLHVIPPKNHFGTLTYQRGSHHDEDTCEAFIFQTRQAGAPFQNTHSLSMMDTTLHPCWTTTSRTLDRTTKAIGQTTTSTTTTKCITTPKTSVKLPTPIPPPTNKILDTPKRGIQVPVIPDRINALSSAKMSMAWEAVMKTSWKNRITYD